MLHAADSSLIPRSISSGSHPLATPTLGDCPRTLRVLNWSYVHLFPQKDLSLKVKHIFKVEWPIRGGFTSLSSCHASRVLAWAGSLFVVFIDWVDCANGTDLCYSLATPAFLFYLVHLKQNFKSIIVGKHPYYNKQELFKRERCHFQRSLSWVTVFGFKSV